MKTRPEIPCEVCGCPRTFLAGLQWCTNCGWNRQSALSGLRLRFRIMAGVAACIVIGEAFLLRTIPRMGIIYLPLAGFLAAAVAVIPYREYRSLQRTSPVANNCPSREFVEGKLQRLKPQLRISALLLLGLASVTDIGLFLVPGPWDRILPASILLVVIALFGGQLLMERRIAGSYTSTLARIVRFERRSRGRRAAIYEYQLPAGIPMTGKGGPLVGFSVGMTVPVLYNTLRPDQSLPVPDFIFYRIRAELPE